MGEVDTVPIHLPLCFRKVAVDGGSRSNSYYVALDIRLIAKEPQKDAFDKSNQGVMHRNVTAT